MPHSLIRDGFLASDDPSLIDAGVVHGFLREAYWCQGIPRSLVERAINNSLCFGVYTTAPQTAQVGFARVITDRATFAYLADVFILPQFRARGLSKLLMSAVSSHPDLQGLRRWMLLTRDAHGLYEQFGFSPPAAPDRVMERYTPGLYARADTPTAKSRIPGPPTDTARPIHTVVQPVSRSPVQ